MALDNEAVPSKTEILKSLLKQQKKNHVVRDGSGRIVFVFEAPVSTANGDPCLCTEYAYEGAGLEIKSSQERVYAWKSAWDSSFTFDATANYDPDGNGVL